MSQLTEEEERLVARLDAVEHAKQMKKNNFDKESETVIESIILDLEYEINVSNFICMECMTHI